MAGLRFDFALPKRESGGERRTESEGLRVLVIADLSANARANFTADAPLAAARIVRIDVDNFEATLRKLRPEISLRVASGEHPPQRMAFESIEDFHPDRLYDSLPIFADTSTLERLLGAKPAAATQHAPASPPASPLDRMLRELVAPHVVPDRSAAQAALAENANTALAAAMRRVLHASEFQRLEACWRALRWLVHENALGHSLEVSVLDVSRAQLIADLRACQGELERSQAYRLVQQQVAGPDGRAFALVVADLSFAGSDEDVSLFAGLGALAAHAGGCLLAGADPAILGCSDLARKPERGDWAPLEPALAARIEALRTSAVAPFIGLCLPRVLGRLPYGRRSDPIERFDFTEFVPDPPHSDFLWLNAAFACAQLIVADVAAHGSLARAGTTLDLGDLPHAKYQLAGGDAIKPCAEVYLDDASAELALARGVMPLLSRRDRNAVRLARLQSFASPPAPLALRRP